MPRNRLRRDKLSKPLTRQDGEPYGAGHASEFMARCSIDWEPRLVPLNLRDPVLPCTGYRAIVRDGVTPDHIQTLGVVSDQYRITPNASTGRLLDGLAQAYPDLKLHGGGNVRDGRMTYVMADLGKSFAVGDKGVDEVKQFCKITMRHDGGGASRMEGFFLRMVCTNGLHVQQRRSVIRLPHLGDVETALTVACMGIGTILQAQDDEATVFQRLAREDMSPARFDALLDRMWPRPVAPSPDKFPATDEGIAAFDRARELHETATEKWLDKRELLQARLGAPTQTHGGNAGTWWAGLNAVTEYLQHDAARDDVSVLYGTAADETQRAYALVQELSGV